MQQSVQEQVADAVKQSYNPLKSMTVWGTLGALAPYVVNSFDPHALPQGVTVGVTALGVLVGMLGLRNAHSKTVQAVANIVSAIAGKTAGQ